MSNNLQIVISASLQSRTIWDVLSPVFLNSSDVNVTSGGSLDDTYDIAIYVPTLDVVLHALVVTPSGIEEANRPATLVRAEKLVSVHRNDSENRHIVIIFLTSDTAFQKASRRCSIDAYVCLQALLFDSASGIDIPDMMLAEPDGLLHSLKEHYYAVQRSIMQAPDIASMSNPSSSGSTLYLLEQIVAQGSDQLTCQQNVNILSDLFPSLRALSAAVRTTEGHRLITDYLGDQLARHVVSFWNEERIYG